MATLQIYNRAHTYKNSFPQWLSPSAIVSKAKVKEVFEVIMGSVFIALFAQVAFYLPNTTVPYTLQTSSIILVGWTLGPKKGFKATFCYLIEGAIGLPVWAMGASGFQCLVGPTGGYLLCFLLLAYFSGLIKESTILKIKGKWLALSLLLIFHLLCGSLWLIPFLGFKLAFKAGFFPFILSGLFKLNLLFPILKKGV